MVPVGLTIPVVARRIGTNTHGGELCIIFLTAPCGERVNPGFADAGPVEMMQD
jgi:hypothetical protein